MTKIKGSRVLITGGASGIGKLMGQRFLEEGARHLVIWDINEQTLEQAASHWRDQGFEAYPYQVDVAQPEQIEEMAQDVLNNLGPIDILINNAGIVVGKDFADHSRMEVDATIDINVKGVMHMARVFLPAMIEQGHGHIVNIASAAAMIPNPKMSVYAASKWAVLGWSESLRLELERLNKSLHVTTITPSYIDTGMFEGVKAPLLTPILKPREIVDEIIKAIRKDRILVRAPKIVNLLPILRGVLPTRIFDFTAEHLGVYDSMTNFKGRK